MADLDEADVNAEGEGLAAQPAGVPEDTGPISLKDFITEVTPYPEERANRIKFFYKKRERQPERYTYTARGDLEIRSKAGAVEETIPLMVYIPYDTATRETREQNRLDAIGQAEAEYEDALSALRDAMVNYKLTGAVQPVLAAQRAAAEADQVLSRVRYGGRAIQDIANPDIADVLFDEKGGRKLFSQKGKDPFKKQLARLVVSEFPYMSFYGTYMDAPDVEPVADVEDGMDEPAPAEGATRKKLKDGRWARFFFEGDEGANGFLSPMWPVEFTMGSTRFFTALQAYEVERAKEAGQEAIRAALLKTRSTRTMRFITKKFETPPKNSKALWTQIFTAIYQQHPELKAKLLSTGTDALVYADLRKGPAGIGLGERDTGALDPSKWTGENHVGLALETLRYQFREGTAAESARNDDVDEAVISKEEQDAARTAAIIAQQKSKFQFKRKGAAPV